MPEAAKLNSIVQLEYPVLRFYCSEKYSSWETILFLAWGVVPVGEPIRTKTLGFESKSTELWLETHTSRTPNATSRGVES